MSLSLGHGNLTDRKIIINDNIYSDGIGKGNRIAGKIEFILLQIIKIGKIHNIRNDWIHSRITLKLCEFIKGG